MKRFIALLICALMLLCAAGTAEETAPATVGMPAPDFEIETLDGEVFRLSDCRGKVVFINIWATWCPPCVAEMPDIQALSEAYPDDLVVIGVDCMEEEQVVRDFIAENGYTYIFGIDDGVIGGELYPTYAIPNSIFIDPEGVVSSIEVGMADYASMEERYQAALAGSQGAE